MKKKKTLVLVALAVVLVGVGAFGFLRPEPQIPPKVVARSSDAETGPAEKDAPAKKSADVGKDERAEQLMALVTGPLSPRDPFEPQGSMGTEAVTAPPPAGASAPPPPPQVRRTPSVPPLDPLAGSLGGTPSGMGISPGPALRQPGEFGYRVKGVVVGSKPVAVLEDEGGNQRLVPLGGSIDGDSRVVGIEKGRVRIRHRGKDQTLTLSEGQ